MIDNLKTGVLKRILGQEPLLNPKYLDFANHHGFRIAPCGIAKGNESYSVPNASAYLKCTANAVIPIDCNGILNST
jgi:hypothetical protein